MPEPQTLLTGLVFGESPRWHDDRLWLCDWGARWASAAQGARRLAGDACRPAWPLREGAPLERDFPNGMAVTPDNQTLIVAESYGNKLTAFDIAADGSLSDRRVWADLDGGVPDGICLDAENAVWYGDVPNKHCVRVREGGEVLQTIGLDRGCFARMLGAWTGEPCSWWRPSGVVLSTWLRRRERGRC